MKIARYESQRDNVPRAEDVSWAQLVAILAGPPRRSDRCSSYPCADRACTGKGGPAWSPVEIEGRRLNANVRSVQVAVFDLDHVTEQRTIEVLDVLDARGLAWILHSTHSHNPPNDCGLRLVLRLSRPVRPREWARVRAAIIRELNLPADPATGDLSRLYYLPDSPVGVAEPIAASRDGADFDVDALLRSGRPAVADAMPEPEPVDVGELGEMLRNRCRPENRALIVRVLRGDPFAQLGEHDIALNKLMSTVAFSLPDAPDEAIMHLIEPSLAATDWRDGIEHLKFEALKKLHRARGRKVAEDAKNEEISKRLRARAPHVEAPTALAHRAEIEITTNESDVTDKAIAALGAMPDLFQRADALVEVISEAGAPARIQPCRPARVRDLLTACARIYKVNRSTGIQTDAHPPDFLAQAISARGRWQGIRKLKALAETPSLRADGTVLQSAGFDEASGLYLTSTLAVPVADVPTHADALRALDELLEVVCDFPFAAEEHRSAWLASLLTMFARHAFDGPVPLTLFDSSTPGTGKSLLADVNNAIATGRAMPRSTNTEDDAEQRKVITTHAVEGTPAVLIDNIGGALGTPALDAALTSTIWSDRILGATKSTGALPLWTLWFASGNNVVLRGDLPRRVLHVRIEAPVEKPEERSEFRHPRLIEWVKSERPRLVAAALTILRAFVAAGRPGSDSLPTWGSYEAWSALVRGAVVWVGLPDPVKTRQELVAHASSDLDALRALIEDWHALDPKGAGLTAAQIVERRERSERVREAIAEMVPTPPGTPPDSKRLAYRLRKHRRRIVGGKYLDAAAAHGGVNRWHVRAVTTNNAANDAAHEEAA